MPFDVAFNVDILYLEWFWRRYGNLRNVIIFRKCINKLLVLQGELDNILAEHDDDTWIPQFYDNRRMDGFIKILKCLQPVDVAFIIIFI